MTGELAQPRPGQVIAVHSTIRPGTALELAARAAAAGEGGSDAVAHARAAGDIPEPT